MKKDKWAGIQYYRVDGYWEDAPDEKRENYIVSVFANDWQGEHAEDQPCDSDIFFSFDAGTTMAQVKEQIDEFVVTKIRKMKSLMED